MKTEINIGDTIETYCTGAKVTGEVIEVNENHFTVEHEPVKWGNDTHTKTTVAKSSYLQIKHGGSTTSPKSWKNGKEINL
jgi:hypothetical protein